MHTIIARSGLAHQGIRTYHQGTGLRAIYDAAIDEGHAEDVSRSFMRREYRP
jgi:hypothetical protein